MTNQSYIVGVVYSFQHKTTQIGLLPDKTCKVLQNEQMVPVEFRPQIEHLLHWVTSDDLDFKFLEIFIMEL